MIRKMVIRWHSSLSLRSQHNTCVISHSQVQLNSSFLSSNTRPNWANDHAYSHKGSDKQEREKPGPEITTLFNTEWRTSPNIPSCTLVSLIQNIKVFNWSSMPSNCIVNLFCSCPLYSLLQATISMYNMKPSVPRPPLSRPRMDPRNHHSDIQRSEWWTITNGELFTPQPRVLAPRRSH